MNSGFKSMPSVTSSYRRACEIRELYATGLRKHSKTKLAIMFDTNVSYIDAVVENRILTKSPKKPKNFKEKVKRDGRVYYILNDGRIWSFSSQKFVQQMPRCRRRVSGVKAPKGRRKKISLPTSKHGYYIYDDGRVWSIHFAKFVDFYVDKKGYHFINRVPLHRLVLTYFRRPPKKGEVGRHLDGNPANNCISNLDWGSPQDNVDDMIVHGTEGKGKVYANARMTESKAQELIDRWEKSTIRTMREFAIIAVAETGLTETSIYNLLTGATWKQLRRAGKKPSNKSKRSGSGDMLTDKQKARIRERFAETKLSKSKFVAQAAERLVVSKYAIKAVLDSR